MIYESRMTKKNFLKIKERNQYHLSASQKLSPDKIASDRLNRLSIGGHIEKTIAKNTGDIINKRDRISPVEKTLDKVYKKMEDLTSGKMRH